MSLKSGTLLGPIRSVRRWVRAGAGLGWSNNNTEPEVRNFDECSQDSRNPFPNFGTLPGEPIERSGSATHFRGDPLPAGPLRAKRSNPSSVHNTLRPAETVFLSLSRFAVRPSRAPR